MKKIIIGIGITIVAIVVVAVWQGVYQYKQAGELDFKKVAYQVEGQAVTLNNNTTRYFGNDVVGDFNNDGQNDVAFLLTQNPGGSGTFYYVAVALGSKDGYRGTNAIFLGDRIAPQSTEFRGGMIIVNFADRKLGESFSTRPSIGVSKYFRIIDGELREVMPKIREAEARIIAEKTCIKGGESLVPGYYNENSKTWWFDANLNTTKEGCNPACVVSEETKKAEINWRCTGLIAPKESAGEIQKLFAEKYPKYAKTITVSMGQETQNHARGDVIFEVGAPGGIFLAAKIDGQWQIVFNGNGEIPCNLSKYGFPNEMLFDCAK